MFTFDFETVTIPIVMGGGRVVFDRRFPPFSGFSVSWPYLSDLTDAK